jgi:TonB family protein
VARTAPAPPPAVETAAPTAIAPAPPVAVVHRARRSRGSAARAGRGVAFVLGSVVLHGAAALLLTGLAPSAGRWTVVPPAAPTGDDASYVFEMSRDTAPPESAAVEPVPLDLLDAVDEEPVAPEVRLPEETVLPDDARSLEPPDLLSAAPPDRPEASRLLGLGARRPSVGPSPPAPAAAPPPPAPAPSARVAAPPVRRAALRAVFRSKPAYPPDLERAGIEGAPLVRLLVTPQGLVADASLAESSGYAAFDAAAVEAVRAWRFEPPGRLAQAEVRVRFRLAE